MSEDTAQPATAVASDRAKLTIAILILALCWALLLAGLSAWEYRRALAMSLELARTDCRATYDKEISYRRWAAMHGGVYVPISENAPPNPYLAQIPERDITTPSGKGLTLVNPAYMTRQVHELSKEQYGLRGHITSLKLLRPENAADEWETTALRAFESGDKEVSSIEMIDNIPYMRLMRPMITESGCLKCHGHQGYKVGDIRGGISVSVPWVPYRKVALGQLHTVWWGYGGIWLVGMAGLWVVRQRLQQYLAESAQSQQALQESEARLQSLFRISQYVAKNIQEMLDYALDEAIMLTSSTIGYIYHYHEDTKEFVLNSWSRDVMPKCSIALPQTVYQLDMTGIWGEAVRQRQAIIINDFQKDNPLKKGYPPGHVELCRFLTVPIFAGTQIVAVVGVANKECDYVEVDIRQLTLLMNSVWQIVERRRAEDDLLKLNAELELRVAERTKELEGKADELEQFNRLFVDRELRMIELKRKIADLEKEVASLQAVSKT